MARRTGPCGPMTLRAGRRGDGGGVREHYFLGEMSVARILDRIDGPAQLRTLSPAELDQLAQEIRREIIETVALRGGHLAPNLGTVELTLALHIAFQTPRD